MTKRRSVFMSIASGVGLSIATTGAIVAAALCGASFLVGAFVLFGAPFAYLLGWALPTSVLYQLFPAGGGPAFAALCAIGGLVQLFLIFSIVSYYLWFSKGAR